MLIVGGLVVLAASFFGGAVGFAYGLVALPLLLLVGVPLDQVVAINLTIAMVTRVLALSMMRGLVCWPRALRMVAGVVPGALLGTFIVRFVAEDRLQIGAGILVLLAVGLVILRPRIRPLRPR